MFLRATHLLVSSVVSFFGGSQVVWRLSKERKNTPKQAYWDRHGDEYETRTLVRMRLFSSARRCVYSVHEVDWRLVCWKVERGEADGVLDLSVREGECFRKRAGGGRKGKRRKVWVAFF